MHGGARIPDPVGEKDAADNRYGDQGDDADNRKIGDQVFGISKLDAVDAFRCAKPPQIGHRSRQDGEVRIDRSGRDGETHPRATPASRLETNLIRQGHEDRHHDHDASCVRRNDETQHCADDGDSTQDAKVTARKDLQQAAGQGSAEPRFLNGGADDQTAKNHPDGGGVKSGKDGGSARIRENHGQEKENDCGKVFWHDAAGT